MALLLLRTRDLDFRVVLDFTKYLFLSSLISSAALLGIRSITLQAEADGGAAILSFFLTFFARLLLLLRSIVIFLFLAAGVEVSKFLLVGDSNDA